MSVRKIELDEDDEEIISEQIAHGRFPNANEVLKAGLVALEKDYERDLDSAYQRDPEWIARLCAAAKIGFDQLDAGQGITLKDDAEIRAFMDQMLQRVLLEKASPAETR